MISLSARNRAQIIHVHAEGTRRIAIWIMFRLALKRRIIQKAALMLNHGNRQSKRVIHLPHPNRVATSKIIVHRDDMYAFPRNRVQINRRSGRKRLSFTRTHFRNHSPMERNASNKLNIVLALVKNPLRHFSNESKSLRHEIIKLLAAGESCFIVLRFRLQLIRREIFKRTF